MMLWNYFLVQFNHKVNAPTKFQDSQLNFPGLFIVSAGRLRDCLSLAGALHLCGAGSDNSEAIILLLTIQHIPGPVLRPAHLPVQPLGLHILPLAAGLLLSGQELGPGPPGLPGQ